MKTFIKSLVLASCVLLLAGITSVRSAHACSDPNASNYDALSEVTYDCTYASNPVTSPANATPSATLTSPANATPAASLTSPANATPPASLTSPANATPPAPLTSPARTGGGTFYLQNPLDPKFNSVGGLIQGALEIFSYLVIIFAVLMLIWVGLQFILAQGKPDRMKELKNWLLWIVVGVAIVIGARIIVSIVINTLQATGTVNTSVIQSAQNGLQGVSPTP